MEILLAIVAVVIVGTLIYFNRGAKSLDVNNDGKIDSADAKAAVQNAVTGVKAKADVNKDGKVDSADLKVAAGKVKRQAKSTAKSAVTKAKTTAKTVAKTAKTVTKKAPGTRAKKETKVK